MKKILFSFPARKRAGFTLIELLVVVLIIGILASVALPQYERAVKKARLMKLAPLAKALADAEEVYWLSNNRYTPQIEDLDVQYPAGLSLAGGASDSGFVKLSDGTTVDLLDGSGYISSSTSAGACIYIVLKQGPALIRCLTNSAYPNALFCGDDEGLCKSMGGVAFGSQVGGHTVWKL